VIDDEIYDRVLKKFSELRAHVCNKKETKLLARTVIDPATGFMQPIAVGRRRPISPGSPACESSQTPSC
jgi:hypothetical protein